jgi:hypothetical protein
MIDSYYPDSTINTLTVMRRKVEKAVDKKLVFF